MFLGKFYDIYNRKLAVGIKVLAMNNSDWGGLIMLRKKVSMILIACFLILAADLVYTAADQKKALTYQDIMRFKDIRNPVISENGLWVAYTTQPDRGDGKVIVRGVKNGKEYLVERGCQPVISKDGNWVAMIIKPLAAELAAAKKDKPKQGMALFDTRSGRVQELEKVKDFALSDDSRWLAYHLYKEKDKVKKQEEEPEEEKKDEKKLEIGSTMVLSNLNSGEEVRIPFALSYAFDTTSSFLVYAIGDEAGEANGLYYLELSKQGRLRKALLQEPKAKCSQLVWTKTGSNLVFLVSKMTEKKDTDSDASVWVWKAEEDKLTQVVTSEDAPKGWFLPAKNQLKWSRDGRRLFFGFKPEEFRQVEEDKKEKDKNIDLFDVESILKKSEVDVWHWNDPLINTNQKNIWPRVKDQTYTAVFFIDSGRLVQLADRDVPEVWITDNPEYVLAVSSIPYQKEITWYGRLRDIYIVNLSNGARKKVVSRLEDRFSLSPGGGYVVYYQDKNWHLFDRRSGHVRNLTKDIGIPFYDEDHDYPSKVPGYGIAGWVKEDQAVLLYDKYDVWKFPVESGKPVNITGGKGRKGLYTFRTLRLDPDKEFYDFKEKILLSAFHNREKNWGFYSCDLNGAGVKKLLEERKKFKFLAKAKKADKVLFSREDYAEFPDLWISGLEFKKPEKISNVNPQISEFAWGTAELVEWDSMDGIPLQGVLIKPGNYAPGKKYPVIVYYYRFFSQRLHEFNQTVINHRPCFPFYASNGYVVFLPDIRFEIGLPGPAATKCLVPGVQKIINMGIADPDAIGLHGHSWSGYQTAFVITQTNIFTCAVAGAPVSNMTSAYSGIRWGTGLARQFQYEKSQSRIGGSLWEKLELYIENSPVFFADRIETPLLILFGDKDSAVPWYQGIELYLAMRRLEKDCVFLQYRDEPHHPQKYPNKLDWFKKMKEYFDHYLKGKPGPDWIIEGIPYRGK